MTDNFEPKEFFNSLTFPDTDLAKLSFCGSNKAAKLKIWVESLHATQIAQTSVVLYKSVPELAKLKTDAKTRFEMLEIIRPSVQHCIQGLAKEFLNQPVILPENAQRAAIIAQALQKHMVDGYIACIREIIDKGRQKAAVIDLLAKSLHRAITGIGLIFLRSYQLYTQTPVGLWLLLHGLYRCASYYQVENKPIADPTFDIATGSNSLQAYSKVLLLAISRSNQLSQKDIDLLFNASARWISLVKLSREVSQDSANQFIVIPTLDAPPITKSRFNGTDDDSTLEIDVQALVGQMSKRSSVIDEIVTTKQSGTASVSNDFPVSLADHLMQVWGTVAERKQHRRKVQASAETCIGLVDCHYFINGGNSFEAFIGQNNAAEDWQTDLGRTFSGGLTPGESRSNEGQRFDKPSYRVAVQNTSPGGYCLLWKGEMPARLDAGELIGLKETGRRTWSLGVIRWIKQLKQASQLGVQLLSANPNPCAVAQMYDMGGFSDYMRAIMLPPSKIGDVPATILTAKAPFQNMNTARLMDGQKVSKIKLDKCIFSTGSIKQFSYHGLDAIDSNANENNTANSRRSFDSTWDEN